MFRWPDRRYVWQDNRYIRVGSVSTYQSSVGGVRTAAGFGVDGYNPVSDRLEEGGVLEDWIPSDPGGLHKVCRMIYLRDMIAGPAVDLYKELPWSEYSLTGPDENATRIYTEAISDLNISSLMSDITGEFLMMGKVIGSVTWDGGVGKWIDCIIHDPDFCKVEPRPIRNMPPKVDLKSTPAWQRFAASKDPRDVELRDTLDPDLVNSMRKGDYIPLATENTIYFPRRAAPYDEVGTTFYTRLMGVYAFEKQLFNATLTGIKRKANGTTHITAGSENWEPTEEEMQAIVGMFQSAEQDPVGAIVVTRSGVETNKLDGHSGLWKLSDEWSFLKEAKMNALGINDALLSGDQTLSTKEAALSIFIDRLRAMRVYGTREIIINKLCRPVAEAFEIYEPIPKETAHRYRVTGNRQLWLPEITWAKQLQPIADEDYLSILTTMKEEGVPIPIRVWAAAGGFDIDRAMKLFDKDVDDRKKIAEWKKKTGQGEGEEVFGSAGNFMQERTGSPVYMARQVASTPDQMPVWHRERWFVVPDLTMDRFMRTASSLQYLGEKAVQDEEFMRKWLHQTYTPYDTELVLYLLVRADLVKPYSLSTEVLGDIVAFLSKNIKDANVFGKELWLISRWFDHTDKRDVTPIDVSDVLCKLPKSTTTDAEFLTGSIR